MKWMNEIWLIVTDDYYKAQTIIQQQIDELYNKNIHFEEHILSQYDTLTKFSNGLKIYWIPPIDCFLGCRISKLWIDKNIKKEMVETIYKPILENNKNIIWI